MSLWPDNARCVDCGAPQEGHTTDHRFLTLVNCHGLVLPCQPLEPDDCVTCDGSGKDDKYGSGRNDWQYCEVCRGTGKKP